MKIFGMEIETDESQLEDAVKFVHPDGREDVFVDGEKVIEGDSDV